MYFTLPVPPVMKLSDSPMMVLLDTFHIVGVENVMRRQGNETKELSH